MSSLLAAKNIGHWLDIRHGRNHDWPVWKEMFPHYLSLLPGTG
jgi:esterase/lipase superfamily enzyme